MDNLLALSARGAWPAASRSFVTVLVALAIAGCGGAKTEPATAKPTMSATDAKLISQAPAGTKAAIVHVMGFGTASVEIQGQGATQDCMSFEWEDPVHYSQVCWAYVPTSGSATLTATPTNGSKFLGWGTGPCSGSTAASCALTMDRHHISNVGFDPGGATEPKSEYRLKVDVLGFVDGEIAASPSVVLDCQSSDRVSIEKVCTATVAAGTRVTLTATPTVAGSTFTGWGGQCSGTGSCTVTMDRDVGVTAGFAMPGSGSGGGTGGSGGGSGGGGATNVAGIWGGAWWWTNCGPGNTCTSGQRVNDMLLVLTQSGATVTGNALSSAVTPVSGSIANGVFSFRIDYANRPGYYELCTATASGTTPGSIMRADCTTSGAGTFSFDAVLGAGPGGTGSTATGAPAWAVGTWSGTGTCANSTLTATSAGAAAYSDTTGARGTGTLDGGGNYAVTGVPSGGVGFFAHRGTWTQVSANVIRVNADLSYDGVTWAQNGGVACDLSRVVPVTPTAPKISGHTQHSAAIHADGTLWGWGANARGQVGDGTRISRYVPVLIGTGYSAVALGFYHSVALKQDGTLWAWGWNYLGTVGDGTNVDRSAPVNIGSGYSAIAAGEGHSFAIKPGGMLWGWGYNGYGQLGDGTTTDRNRPTFIGSGFATVAAGYHHSAGLKTDGTLWTWGENYYGQLGDGSGLPRASPTQIGTGFASVAAGYQHTVALKADGSLWAWGWNAQGQLGDGTTVSRSMPVQIGSGFTQVFTSLNHNVALKADGSLWAWGSNSSGQLGDGTTTSRDRPTLIGMGFVAAATGTNHTLAMKSDGSLWAWGSNNVGQVGDGTVTSRTIPVPVGPPGSGTPVASTLVFSQEPPIDVVINVPIAPVVCARVLDQFANPYTVGSFLVTLGADPLSPSLALDAPALEVNSVNGEACFPGLQALTAPTPPGAQARVVASSSGLGPALSGRFNVNQPAVTRLVGGVVTGLAGAGLVLRNNGGDDLPIAASGTFTFPTALVDGTTYLVTVATQPTNPAQVCTVTHGSGVASGIDVTSVAVNCTQPPGTPVASFVANPNSGAPGQAIALDARSSYHSDPARSIVEYTWDFGDGTTGSGSTSSHAYAMFGTYTVTLTVVDDNIPARSSSVSMSVTINQGNQPPVAAFSLGSASSAEVGRPAAFDARSSYDPDAAAGDAIVSYTWDFGDGGTGTGQAPSHTYSSAGTYLVRLYVTDTFGATGTTTASVTVVVPAVAIGGMVTAVGADRVHTFTTNGTFTVLRTGSVQVLVVGGGGGGGQSRAGGGGGGGVISVGAYAVTGGDVIQVTVGTGGVQEANGTDSTFGALRAYGGGAGRGGDPGGASGGSGGGGASCYPGGFGTVGQGNNGGSGLCGGSSGGGGGGAGGAGGPSAWGAGGIGGDGILNSINGTPTYYGGGGGGGAGITAGPGGAGGGGAGGVATAGAAGRANSGGGGGGGGSTSAATIAGGPGGSGIVIVRYTPSSFAP